MRVALLLLMATAALQSQQGFPDGPDGFRGPSVIQKAEPEYTHEAAAAKVEGTVVLSARIGANGIASDVKVVRGLGKGLDQKAIECLAKWRFSPKLRWGKPVAGYATVEIQFRLPNSV